MIAKGLGFVSYQAWKKKGECDDLAAKWGVIKSRVEKLNTHYRQCQQAALGADEAARLLSEIIYRSGVGPGVLFAG